MTLVQRPIETTTLYVVDWERSKMDAIGAGIGAAAERLGISPIKPLTLVGVAALYEADFLIEIDAIAVLA